VVAALITRRNGSASPEIVVARTGLGRVEGYSVLAGLEREGLVTCCPFEGVESELHRQDVGWRLAVGGQHAANPRTINCAVPHTQPP
jgi:hypothetical protein